MIARFNHVVGLPKKDGKEMPPFDYESDRLMQKQKLKRLIHFIGYCDIQRSSKNNSRKEQGNGNRIQVL